ncbi:hypothetical protein [Amantichitinum ursilacus]|uniref:Uncharacterized protein n=1 Tax=Amantichitinum ursilacus TaxID=857265 RepID=A0A0N0XHT1_9NEIS|nr:hypothetical protein [Amantichitinum ursilacus]KPC52138.1 hypothetical protein WG78_13800 [Amantichitinum ursilacus]
MNLPLQHTTGSTHTKWLLAGCRTLWQYPMLALGVTILIGAALCMPALLPTDERANQWFVPMLVSVLGWSIVMPLAWRHQPALAGRPGWLRWCAAMPWLVAMAVLTQSLNHYMNTLPASTPLLPGKTMIAIMLFLPCWLFAPVLIVLDQAGVVEACLTAYRLFWRNLGSVICNQGALLLAWLCVPLLLDNLLSSGANPSLRAWAPYLTASAHALFFVLLQASNYEAWRDRCGAP